MISRELEVCLHQAFVEARADRHEFIGVEHLLIELLSQPEVAGVLSACGAKLDELRKGLVTHIDQHIPQVAIGRSVDTQPTLGFQRAIQSAILHVTSVGKNEVSGLNVLVAILGEADSAAVRLLREQNIQRVDVVRWIAHGAFHSSENASGIHEVAANELQVILFNDDYTPMEFVVQVLEKFFGMDEEEAKEVMLEVHRTGKAVCGLYSREAAESAAKWVNEYARKSGHPLQCGTAVQK